MLVYIYALSYQNPYNREELFALFLASPRMLTPTEATTKAVEAVTVDGLGNEWVEAVAQGAVCGPLRIEGKLPQPSIAIVVD